MSVENYWQHQGQGVQYGHMCGSLAGGSCQNAGEGREGEASDDDSTARDAAVWGEHSAVLQRTVQMNEIDCVWLVVDN